jgi:hypothetical protein
VAFNECNGWHAGRLSAIADACGYEHYELLECKTNFHLAVMSKSPIRLVTKVVRFANLCSVVML